MGHQLPSIHVPLMAGPWRHRHLGQVSWASKAKSRSGGICSRVLSRAISGPSVYSTTAQVFDQINFYPNQSDWSVESKWAFPRH